MAETATAPDFDQIAQQILTADENAWTTQGRQKDLTLVAHVADQLRQVWNARGAADVAARFRSAPPETRSGD